MRLGVAVLLLVAAGALSGCFDPHRATVPADVLDRTGLAWVESKMPETSRGLIGTKSIETRYRFDPPGQGAPYAALLQVVSFRRSDAPSNPELLDLARTAVATAAGQENITLSDSGQRSGERTLQNGLKTSWFIREGSVEEGGGLFPRDTKVRIVGEVGTDGRSRTSVIAIGIAEVDRQIQCPLLGPCNSAQDLRSWSAMVADERGSLGAVGDNGLLWHLVTH